MAAAGNIGTEELACTLRRSGVDSGLNLNLNRLIGSATLIESEPGTRVPALPRRAGDFPGTLSPERGPRRRPR